MRIFVTASTGFIGSTLVQELIQAGHKVHGLTHSEAGAEKLRESGAEVLHVNLEGLDSLRKGAADGEGSQFEKNAAEERKAIAALGEVLVGSDRSFVLTSGIATRPTWTAGKPQRPSPLRHGTLVPA